MHQSKSYIIIKNKHVLWILIYFKNQILLFYKSFVTLSVSSGPICFLSNPQTWNSSVFKENLSQHVTVLAFFKKKLIWLILKILELIMTSCYWHTEAEKQKKYHGLFLCSHVWHQHLISISSWPHPWPFLCKENKKPCRPAEVCVLFFTCSRECP